MSIGRLNYWISRNALNADEIDSNRFLKAACRYGDTAIQYGRDRYSGKDMPLFADCIHTEHLRAPRSMTSHRTGTELEPTVWRFFPQPAEPDKTTGFLEPVHWGRQICQRCRRSRRIHVQQLLVRGKRPSALGKSWLCGFGNR